MENYVSFGLVDHIVLSIANLKKRNNIFQGLRWYT